MAKDVEKVAKDLRQNMARLAEAEEKAKKFIEILETARHDGRSRFYKFFLDFKQRTHFSFLNEMLEKIEDNAGDVHRNYMKTKALYNDLLYESGRPNFDLYSWMSNNEDALDEVKGASDRVVVDYEGWMKQTALDKLKGLIRPEFQAAGYPTAPEAASGYGKKVKPVESQISFPEITFAFIVPFLGSALTTFMGYDLLKRTLGAHDPHILGKLPSARPTAHSQAAANSLGYRYSGSPSVGPSAHGCPSAHGQAPGLNHAEIGRQRFYDGAQSYGRQWYHSPSVFYGQNPYI